MGNKFNKKGGREGVRRSQRAKPVVEVVELEEEGGIEVEEEDSGILVDLDEDDNGVEEGDVEVVQYANEGEVIEKISSEEKAVIQKEAEEEDEDDDVVQVGERANSPYWNIQARILRLKKGIKKEAKAQKLGIKDNSSMIDEVVIDDDESKVENAEIEMECLDERLISVKTQRVPLKKQKAWREPRFQPDVLLVSSLNKLLRSMGLSKSKASKVQEIKNTLVRENAIGRVYKDTKALSRENAIGRVNKRAKGGRSTEIVNSAAKEEVEEDDDVTFKKDFKRKQVGDDIVIDDEEDLVLEALPPDKSQLGLHVRKLAHVRDLREELEEVGVEDKVKMVERLLRNISMKSLGEEGLLVEEDCKKIKDTLEESDVIDEDVQGVQGHDIMSDLYMAALKSKFDFWVSPEEKVEQPARKKSRRDLKPRYKA